MTEMNKSTHPEGEIIDELIEEDIDHVDAEDVDAKADDTESSEVGEAKEENTLTFKRSHIYAALLPLAFVVGLAVGYIFWGRATPDAPAAAPAPAAAEAAPAQGEVQRYDISEDDDPVWGSDEASITIIEFSDYECPYCRRWHVEVWPQIKETYPDQVRLVFRDFPLSTIHANATPAAAAANCAGEQNNYWEFSELLFGMELGLDKKAYEQYASILELELEAFTECLESGDQNDEVMADYEYAANLGVRSTPTFFINGIALVGAQPFEFFQNLIEQELAGEIP